MALLLSTLFEKTIYPLGSQNAGLRLEIRSTKYEILNKNYARKKTEDGRQKEKMQNKANMPAFGRKSEILNTKSETRWIGAK